MSTDTIICPNCQTEIEISEALTVRLKNELRREYDQERKTKEQELTKREQKITDQLKAVVEAEERIEQRVSQSLAAEREKLLAKALVKAKEDVAVELKDQSEQLREAKEKIAAAQEAELTLRKQKRELEEYQRTMELTVNRKLDEERRKIRDEAKKEVDAERDLKDAEKNKVIEDLRRQISDLQRRSEQGSQQLQGEVMELSLEEQLRRLFPTDEISPVPKGVHGGDVVHNVRDAALGLCGTILWESKRTKNWSDAWLPKLRDDQRAAKAQVAILVSIELPEDVSTFAQIDGIWISGWIYASQLAAVLRSSLIQLAAANRAMEGRQDKMELLYKYLAGPEFKHRVEGIVESFVTLQSELDKERRSMERLWSMREKQLKRAVVNTAGLYGDLQGIVGARLPVIKQLQLPDASDEYDAEGDGGPSESK